MVNQYECGVDTNGVIKEKNENHVIVCSSPFRWMFWPVEQES